MDRDTPPEINSKAPSKPAQRFFDETWIANRLKFRKTLKGTRLTLDPITGYLEPVGRDGFTAEDRKTFIERLRICNNYAQICKSLNITTGSFYDAIVVDRKFRDDVNAANKIENRNKQLNNSLAQVDVNQKEAVIKDLMERAKKYGLPGKND